jgi:hypothetical protein
MTSPIADAVPVGDSESLAETMPLGVVQLNADDTMDLMLDDTIGVEGVVPSGPVYVTGDVHGCAEQLQASLFRSGITDADGNWNAGSAWLWFLGDLFDRGPDGIGVIDTVMRLQEQAPESGGRVDCLLGNHEVMLLAAYRLQGPGAEKFQERWLGNGGQPRDLRALTEEHARWLEGLPAMALVDDHLLIHSDTVGYRELGGDIATVNANVQSVLREYTDLDAWDRLTHLVTTRFAFADDGTTANEFLAEFGGAQIVHGHSPIPLVFDIPAEDITGPMIYAEGRAVNMDTGTFLGGPCLISPLPSIPPGPLG